MKKIKIVDGRDFRKDKMKLEKKSKELKKLQLETASGLSALSQSILHHAFTDKLVK